MLFLGLLHINGDAADDDTFTISLQLQTYIAGKFPTMPCPLPVEFLSQKSICCPEF